jgi:hypothetical protein
MEGLAKRPPTFSGHLWRSFRSTYGPPVTVGSAIVTTIAWLTPPPTTVPFPVFLLFGLMTLIVTLTFFDAARTAFDAPSYGLPAILAFTSPPAEYQNVRALCLTEASMLFSQDTRVSFYHLDDSHFELLVGLGRVLIVQQDGSLQIALTEIVPSQDGLLESLVRNDKRVLSRIIVKPTVPVLPYEPSEAS